jgi:hypothetical protein
MTDVPSKKNPPNLWVQEHSLSWQSKLKIIIVVTVRIDLVDFIIEVNRAVKSPNRLPYQVE